MKKLELLKGIDGYIIDHKNQTYKIVKNDEINGSEIFKFKLLTHLSEIKLKKLLNTFNYKIKEIKEVKKWKDLQLRL